jgi:hypothetical protein
VTFQHRRFDVCIEEANRVAAAGLGAIEREVGIAEQSIDVRAVLGGERNTDTDADRHAVSCDPVRLAGTLLDAAGEGARFIRAVDARLQNHELVAADPCHGIEITRAVGEPFGNLAQQLVADRMTESVVDGLEAIEVDAKNCKTLAIPFFATDRLLDAPVEQVTVGKACQRIVMSEPHDLLLGTLARGDVRNGAHRAAVRQRGPVEFEHGAGRRGALIDRVFASRHVRHQQIAGLRTEPLAIVAAAK